MKKMCWILMINGRAQPEEYATFGQAQTACVGVMKKRTSATVRIVEVRSRDVTPQYVS